ncbi:Di-copper centre-containing protein [Rhizodiscina lignyota]|uniref:Di-copper centre-containing protein n=1 Tax=Rhizodiscina lignyota TaxID=1504668 RepID=A0A9P4IKZ6_9PEZI|nr:Di-copper centre-containing protein [Rhizodiscina lignyota]
MRWPNAFSLAVVFLTVFGVAEGSRFHHSKCTKPLVRKEWRTLCKEEQLDYIRASLCLINKPGRSHRYFPGVTSRHDDFAASHINATGPPVGSIDIRNDLGLGKLFPGIHYNGVFLPWHRWFIWQHEQSLRNDCGYKGAHPYWDYSLDVAEAGAQLNKSPVFDGTYGFGGNGEGGTVPLPGPAQGGGGFGPNLGGCVVDGPFKHMTVHLGPDYEFQSASRCLHRNLQPELADVVLAWKGAVVPLLNQKTYAKFAFGVNVAPFNNTLPGIHVGGHICVGGTESNAWSSPEDPMFFMQHANLDRIWNLWQLKDNGKNLWDIDAPIFPNGTGVTKLDTVMYMGDYIAPPVEIKTVMDTLNRDGDGILCYEYENTAHEE